MKVYIATDHRGVDREKEIIDYLKSRSIDVEKSNLEHSDTDDYVDFAIDVAKKVVKDKGSFGILICGTGIGMSIAANKVKGIRAAHCTTKEEAFLTRLDNDANILCIGQNKSAESNKEIINVFLNTDFSKAERHIRRINKISDYEKGK